MIQKRNTVRVGGELVKVSGGQIANTDTTDWKKLVAYFVAVQDVKESSRGLYARTLSQYFSWLESTGRLRNFAFLTRQDILEYKDSLLSSDSPLLQYPATS